MSVKSLASLILVCLLLCSVLTSGMTAMNGDGNNLNVSGEEFTGFTEKSELVGGIESALESDRGNRINITGAKGGSEGDANYPENTRFQPWNYYIGGMVNAKKR